jgi:hypothetical protein
MHNPFDQLAKKVGKGALDASGRTVVQYEISRDAQHADLRHDPDPMRQAERARLGLLGRIAQVVCLVEIFGHAPDGAEIRACLRKHFTHWDECAAQTRAKNKRRKDEGLSPEVLVEPWLWIIAAAISAPLLHGMEAKAAAGWPPGVYRVGDGVFRVCIIVAGELPRDRSTLLVPIMAAGRGLADALADLAALPADAHERVVAEGIVVYLQDRLAGKPTRTSEEEEFIVAMLSTWTEARAQGRNEGRAEGEARALLTVLRSRRISVSEAARERILAESDLARIELWIEKACLAASLADVLDDPS